MSNYIDEGYIKFDIRWDEGSAPSHALMPDLLQYRNKMYALGLIGFYEQYNVGYGNISIKTEQGMIISGTQTGHIPRLSANHYTLVDSYNIEKNALHCVGPVKASSESLTHAAIYECAEEIQAVIHIHNDKMWKKLINILPTSAEEVPYGTPEMALEILRLFNETDFSEKKIMVMAGHEGGIISFGSTLEEAAKNILLYVEND